MFNKYFSISVVLGTMLLSACTMEKTEQKVEEDISVNDEVSDSSATKSNYIELSTEEEDAYGNFQKDLDLQHLSGLEPKSIAKLYVKAGLDQKYDVEYALYTDREEYVQWSKEEHENISESQRGSVEQNLQMFETIDKGTFIQTSDYEGHFVYYSSNGINGFKMMKNLDGIWQVTFMPIQ